MGFFDWFNGLIADGTIAFRGAIVLFASVMFFVIATKSKWHAATTIITAIVCGFVIFMSVGGGDWMAGLIRGETADALGAAVYQLAA